MNKPRFAVADVEAALVKASGLITPAADILAKAYGSCTPATVRNYVKRHKRLQAAITQTVEHALDLAEHKLLGAVTKGNMTAVIFYLKTKGRDRGYVQRWGYVDKDNQPSDAPRCVVVELPYNGRDDPEEE